MATKEFKQGAEYSPQKGDWFNWFEDIAIFEKRQSALDGCFYVEGRDIATPFFLSKKQWGSLLNAGIITIYRDVPDEPYVIPTVVCAYTGGEPHINAVFLPKDQFKDGDKVEVTVRLREQK